MKPITQEWVDKAEADYVAALLLRKSRMKHSRDIVCFHLQQCAEKYLKARLVEAGVAFPKTHNLVILLDLTLPLEPLWIAMRPALGPITAFGTESRYPGRIATPADARSHLKTTTRVRKLVRQSLGMTS